MLNYGTCFSLDHPLTSNLIEKILSDHVHCIFLLLVESGGSVPFWHLSISSIRFGVFHQNPRLNLFSTSHDPSLTVHSLHPPIGITSVWDVSRWHSSDRFSFWLPFSYFPTSLLVTTLIPRWALPAPYPSTPLDSLSSFPVLPSSREMMVMLYVLSSSLA